MKTTTTVHWNKGGIAKEHNERNPELCSHEEHIDLYNEHGQSFHETIFRQDLTDAYNEIFGEAIEEYNAGQKRKDRMKTVESYMDEVENDTRGKRQTKRVNGKRVIDEQARRGKQTEYEVTVKVGNTERERDKNGRTVYDANGHHIRPEELPRELQADILREYCETFQENNPNFKVVSMELHADEGFYNTKGQWEYDAIHPHITFVPWCDGFKQGLSRQNSMNKALEAMGCGGADGYDKWAQKEQERLEAITLQRYREYCLEHPDFAIEHGELEIYHPVHDNLKTGDMDKEQYIREQELTEQRAILEEDIDKNSQWNTDLANWSDELSDWSEGLENASNKLTESIDNLKARENALEAEKAEFEAYRASETQKLEELQRQAELNVRNTEANLEQARMRNRKAVERVNKADEIFEEVVKARALPPQSPERASRMASFMMDFHMKDGRNLYQHFQDAEPGIIQTERENERLMADISRKYGHMRQSFDKDIELGG